MRKNNRALFSLGLILAMLTLHTTSQAEQDVAAMIVDTKESESAIVNAISTNPHPPQTGADKTRVLFATTAIEQLLKLPQTKVQQRESDYIFSQETLNLDIDAACLQKPNCLLANAALQNHLKDIFAGHGSLIEYRHAHIIPWSFEKFIENKKNLSNDSVKPHATNPSDSYFSAAAPANMSPNLRKDEYMIHSYAKFADGHWYHLDVIVTEDDKGQMRFRRFFMHRIPVAGHSLPPGVDC